jgi:L-amino acid N-acyltransferase YncA
MAEKLHYNIRKARHSRVSRTDKAAVMRILNYYILNNDTIKSEGYPHVIPIDKYDEFISISKGYFYVIEVDGVRGYGSLHEMFDENTIRCDIHIENGYTNKGLGEALLLQLISDAEKRGLNIIAEIRTENDRSIRFFKKHGFTEHSVKTIFGHSFTLFFRPCSSLGIPPSKTAS